MGTRVLCGALPGFSALPISSGATRTTFPLAVAFPFRASSRKLCWTPLDASTSPGHFVPFGASVPRESTCPGGATLRYVPRSGFLTLCAASASHGLAGLFHPANALRLHPSGSSPPEEPRRLFAAAMPSCRSSAVALPPPSMAGPTAHHTPPLGKWSWCLWPTSRLCSPRESVPAQVGLAPVAGRAPPGFSPLQGIPRLLRCPRLITVGSSHALSPASARSSFPDRPTAGRATECPSQKWWPCLSRGRLALLRFVAAWSSRFQRSPVLAYRFASGPR